MTREPPLPLTPEQINYRPPCSECGADLNRYPSMRFGPDDEPLCPPCHRKTTTT